MQFYKVKRNIRIPHHQPRHTTENMQITRIKENSLLAVDSCIKHTRVRK